MRTITFRRSIRHGFWRVSALLLLSFTAASYADEAIVKPVKLYEIPNQTNVKADSFLATIDAGQRSKLSFQVPGVISKVFIKEGERVSRGDLLIELDATDYRLAVEVENANYQLARVNHKRDQKLFNKKLISNDKYDVSEANVKAAKAKLDQAQTNLRYTQIKAPFDGVVSLKLIKEHEFASVSQGVLVLLKTTHWKADLSLPVTYVETVGVNQLEKLTYKVRLDHGSDKALSATLSEISTKPNPDTNSYTATVSVSDLPPVRLLSGMSAAVEISGSNAQQGIALPEEAVTQDEKGQPRVWRFNKETQRLEGVQVTINSAGAVTSGLTSGDLVVIAGTSELKQNQRVRPWTKEGGI